MFRLDGPVGVHRDQSGTLPARLFHLDIDGVRYLAAKVLAVRSGYSRDYIARLARERRINGRQLGAHWYVEPYSFWNFYVEQKEKRKKQRKELSDYRRRQYQESCAIRASCIT